MTEIAGPGPQGAGGPRTRGHGPGRAAPERTQPEAPGLLEAPWRLAYLESLDGEQQAAAASGGSCFISEYWASPDRDRANHVLLRTAHGMVMLNAYPYANGHLLAALGEGRPRLMDYSVPQRAALWELVELAVDLCERTLRPQGVNVGINQGRAAGAGVPGHLHAHVVPRWGGDTNFIQVVGQVRVSPSPLEAMAERYRATMARIRVALEEAAGGSASGGSAGGGSAGGGSAGDGA